VTNTKSADLPLAYLKGLGDSFRPAMDAIALERTARPHTWPSWCYFPRSRAANLVRAHQLYDSSEPAFIEHNIWQGATLVTTMAAWRLTRGIYEFDPDLYRTLTDTRISDEIPTELLFRLPEWCVYVPTPEGVTLPGETPYDFFAHLNYGATRNEHRDPEARCLSFVIPYPNNTSDGQDRILLLDVDLSSHSLKKAIENQTPIHPTKNESPEERKKKTDDSAATVSPLLNLLLYLCSEKPEIEGKGQPGNPKRVKTKKGWREFAPSGTRFWNVGVRIGATLRKENTSTRNEERDPTTGRARPRPHIRRAHWNTYWTGPKTAPQTPVLRWIPPTLVAADPNSDEELPATIRPVKP